MLFIFVDFPVIISHNVSMVGRVTLCAGWQSLQGSGDPTTILHVNQQYVLALGPFPTINFQFWLSKGKCSGTTVTELQVTLCVCVSVCVSCT